MNLDKNQLKRHIQKSDLTAIEKRYLELLVDAKTVNRQWIPCSEQLPAFGLTVHVCAKTFEGRYYYFDAYYLASEGRWGTHTSWAKEDVIGYKSEVAHCFMITHWMPLPDPPEEREEGEENE